MRRPGLWLLIVLILTGCVPAKNSINHSDAKYSNEQLLENSGNVQELIKLYKSELKTRENAQTRIKLTKAYITIKDYESAIFTVTPLMKTSRDADVFYYYGKAKYGLNLKTEAMEALQKAYQLNMKNGSVLNLLGVIASEEGDYTAARDWFIKARDQLYDDVTVKNNLAMLDLIEGQYDAAVDKLSPLVSRSGISQKVKANLAIAYAKLGRFKEFERLMKNEKYTDSDIKAIYSQLSQVEFKSAEGPMNIPSP